MDYRAATDYEKYVDKNNEEHFNMLSLVQYLVQLGGVILWATFISIITTVDFELFFIPLYLIPRSCLYTKRGSLCYTPFLVFHQMHQMLKPL